QPGAPQVDGDDAVPLLDAHRLGGTPIADARVGNKDIDLTQRLDGGGNRSARLRLIGDVTFDGYRHAIVGSHDVDCRLRGGAVAVDDSHPGPELCQALTDRPSETLACAGHY